MREMAEGTGYISTDVVHIGTVEPNPCLQTNRCFTYLARNCYPASDQMLDPTESIRVELNKKEVSLNYPDDPGDKKSRTAWWWLPLRTCSSMRQTGAS